MSTRPAKPSRPGTGQSLSSLQTMKKNCRMHFCAVVSFIISLFPHTDVLQQIVDVHYPGIKKKLVSEALSQFYEIRETPGLKKKPSTSEALDWIRLLVADDVDPADLRGDAKKCPAAFARRIVEKTSRTSTCSNAWRFWRGKGVEVAHFSLWRWLRLKCDRPIPRASSAALLQLERF